MRSTLPFIMHLHLLGAAAACWITAGAITSASPSDDLRGYWTFDFTLADQATGGTTQDHATSVGTTYYSATARFGYGVWFNGSNRLTIADSADLNSGDARTVSFWCTIQNWTTNWQTILAKGNNFSVSRNDTDNNALAFSSGTDSVAGGAVNDRLWHHVAAVSTTDNQIHLYVDGDWIATSTTTGNNNDTGMALTLGANAAAPGREWDGFLDEVAWFSRELNPHQISAIYHMSYDYTFSMVDMLQILDTHAAGMGNPVVINGNTWSYQPQDTGSGTFIRLDTDGSGIDLNQPPAIGSFEFVETPVIQPGESATLTWSILNPYDDIAINPGIGNVPHLTNPDGSGSTTVTPTTTTYTLLVSNSFGTSQKSVTVHVGTNPQLPRINEFLADNSSDGLRDEDGDATDWIELHNPGSETVDLAGYHLTDDPLVPDKWSFPPATIAPGAFLIVHASAKDRRTPGQPLHTNFSLDAAGDYLALTTTRPDASIATVQEFSPAFPPQSAGISHGIPFGQTNTFSFLASPSPGSENYGSFAANGPAEDVVFTSTGGVFGSNTTIDIVPPLTAGAVVHYTTDGSTPTTASPVYNAHGTGLYLTATTTVRARIYTPNHLPGDVKSRTFLKLATDGIRTFTSNLPILIIDSFGVNIDADTSTRTQRLAYSVLVDRRESDGITRIMDPPHLTNRGGINVRGNSSANFPKKQYKWELWDNDNNDKKLPVLGMPAESDWVLAAPYSDKTLMRNALVFETANRISGDGAAMRTRFVEVFFNTDGGTVSMADYRGVYAITEQIKRDNDRVDVERLDETTTNPDLITGGYIFKRDKSMTGHTWTTSRGISLGMVEPDTPNAAQQNYLLGHINAMENTLYGPDFADPATGYQAYLETDTFIDAHLLFEIYKNIDGFRLSTYFSKRRDGKIRALPMWDFNLSLGNGNYLQGEVPTGWYYPQLSSTQYFWYPRLFQDPEFTLAYWDRFWEIRHQLFSDTGILGLIDNLDAELDGTNGTPNAVTRNFDKWQTLGSYVWPNASGYASRTTHQSEVDWMKNWLTQRLAWFETQSLGSTGTTARPPSFNQYGGAVDTGYNLTMTDPNGWSNATIYYTTDGSDPRIAVPADPGTTLVSESAACSVLVPTTGNGGASLTIADWTTTSSPANLNQWTNGTQGVGYDLNTNYDPLINTDVQAGMYNGNTSCYIRIPFTITSQAELDAIQQLTLAIRYDDSFIAYINGAEVARATGAPTTPAYNSGSSTDHPDSLAINPIDFNVTSAVASLRIGTNMLAIHGLNRATNSSDALWSCMLHATPQAASSVSTSATAYSAPLTLDTTTEIRARVFDGTRWSPLSRGHFLVGTVPATTNNITISEVHYHPADPTPAELAIDPTFNSSDFEFVEIINIGTEVVDLGNGAFVKIQVGNNMDGIEFTFPVGTMITPGQRLVIVANTLAFQTRYPGIPVAGDYSSRLGNSGEWITLVDADGTIIQSFRYNDLAPWPTAADGLGYSLVLNHTGSNPDPSDPANWSASTSIGGTPGRIDGKTFSGDPYADADRDGAIAILEYLMGLTDTTPSPEHFPHTDIVGSNGDRYLTFTYRHDPDAIDATPLIEHSSDMTTWSSTMDTGFMSFHGSTTAPDGIPMHTYRVTQPVNSSPRLFLRLRAAGY